MGSTMEFRHQQSNANNRRRQQPKATAVMYKHNPYDTIRPADVVSGPGSEATKLKELARSVLPEGTLRLDLFGKVPFFPFPKHTLVRDRLTSAAPPKEERPETLQQLFFGQLPYKVSDAMILWLCEGFAESNVLYIERVMQDKSRKGCMQVFVDRDDSDFIITALDKRVLFDATGVWQAQDAAQLAELTRHCANDQNRFKGHPFRPMVVEVSTSTYVRKQPKGHSNTPTPPPEAYDESEEVTFPEVIAEEPYHSQYMYNDEEEVPAYGPVDACYMNSSCTCPECMGYYPETSYAPAPYYSTYDYGYDEAYSYPPITEEEPLYY